MSTRALITAAIVLTALAAPAGAGAVTLVNFDGAAAQPYQSWADRSRVPTVPTQVQLWQHQPAVCGSTAWICTTQAPAVIYTRDARPIAPVELMHELGHQYDFLMPEWKRVVVRRILQLPSTPWKIAQPHTSLSLSETFADIYSACALTRRRYPVVDVFYDDHVYEVPVRQARRVCSLIRQPNQ